MCPRAADALSNQEHTTESATNIADKTVAYYRHITGIDTGIEPFIMAKATLGDFMRVRKQKP